MSEAQYDVTIIGAGPGGYVAAIRAAHNGLKTLLVDREYLGGVCLNVGCIPSKALIHAGQTASLHQHSSAYGINYAPPEVDWAKVQSWRAGVVRRLTKGVGMLVKGNGADVKMGTARLHGPGRVEITGEDGAREVVRSNAVIVATGSRAIEIPGFSLKDERIWDSTRALAAPAIPKRLAIIGGGYIGLELGQVYASFGSEVTVVEMMDELLPMLPRDLVAPLLRTLKKQKIKILTGAKALGYEETKKGLSLKVAVGDDEQAIACDNILVTVGRRPNTADLGLESVGLKADARGFLPVDERCATARAGVYAIGDVTGDPLLAHRASKMGEVVADVLAGKPAAFDAAAIPAVIYTHPEIATVGPTEAQLTEEGVDFVVGKFPLAASGRALSMHDTNGLVKVLAEKGTGAFLGMQAVGPHVSELVAEGTLAIEMGAVLEDVAATVHPHPSLSEAVMEAALVAMGEAIHVMP